MILKVVSFNIRCCDDKNGHAISERAPRLNAVISPYDADIIAFQEVREKWEEHIDKYFMKDYNMFLKYRDDVEDKEAVAILWKKEAYELVDKGNFWLSDTPEVKSKGWDERFDCYRQCAYVILKDKTTGSMFTVMNTHYGFGDNCQTKSSKLLYEYSKNISDYPTFITGDFNMTPESAGYKEIVRYFTDVNAECDNYTGNTYHGYDPSVPRDTHIDYVFSGEGVKPLCQKLIDKTIEGMYPSDHYGLYSELEM